MAATMDLHADTQQSKRIAQSLAVRVVELESENRRLREEVAELSESQAALTSKNKLFEAKLLELQARLMHAPAGQGHQAKFRSPLIRRDNGELVYRFEKPQRPQSARRYGGGVHVPAIAGHGGGGETARSMPVSARGEGEAHGASGHAEPTAPKEKRAKSAQRPAAARRSVEVRREGGAGDGSGSHRGARPPPPLISSANPPAVQRVYREHRRLSSERASAEKQHKAQAEGGDGGGSAVASTSFVALDEGGGGQGGLEVLQRDLEDGLITSETRLTIVVDYCVDNGSKALTVRHNPGKYKDTAEQLERAVTVTFRGWRVETHVTAHEWTAEQHVSSPVAPTAGQWMPPLGAFEVFLIWEVDGQKRSALLHSKLSSRKFPPIFDMLASVVRLVGAHSSLLTAPEAEQA